MNYFQQRMFIKKKLQEEIDMYSIENLVGTPRNKHFGGRIPVLPLNLREFGLNLE